MCSCTGQSGVEHNCTVSGQRSHVRRDHARESARVRRAAEADLFKQLESLLGISGCERQDKNSVIRLATAAVKAERIVKQVVPATSTSTTQDFIVDQASLSGLIMVVTQWMEVITVSDSICTILGINMVDILGSNLCDYIHPCDHNVIQTAFNNQSDQQQQPIQLAVRMKTLLSEKGRVINMRHADYKVVTIHGRVMPCQPLNKSGKQSFIFCCHLQPIFPASYSLPITTGQFLSHHLPGMEVVDCSPWFHQVGGYTLPTMQEQSFYQFIHPADVLMFQRAVLTLREMGEMETLPYRFLVGGGGLVWLSTVARIKKDKKGEVFPETIICIHTTISNVYEQESLLSSIQMKCKINKNRKPEYLPNCSAHVDDILRQSLKSMEEEQVSSQIEQNMDLFTLIDAENFPETDYDEEALNNTKAALESPLNFWQCKSPVNEHKSDAQIARYEVIAFYSEEDEDFLTDYADSECSTNPTTNLALSAEKNSINLLQFDDKEVVNNTSYKAGTEGKLNFCQSVSDTMIMEQENDEEMIDYEIVPFDCVEDEALLEDSDTSTSSTDLALSAENKSIIDHMGSTEDKVLKNISCKYGTETQKNCCQSNIDKTASKQECDAKIASFVTSEDEESILTDYDTSTCNTNISMDLALSAEINSIHHMQSQPEEVENNVSVKAKIKPQQHFWPYNYNTIVTEQEKADKIASFEIVTFDLEEEEALIADYDTSSCYKNLSTDLALSLESNSINIAQSPDYLSKNVFSPSFSDPLLSCCVSDEASKENVKKKVNKATSSPLKFSSLRHLLLKQSLLSCPQRGIDSKQERNIAQRKRKRFCDSSVATLKKKLTGAESMAKVKKCIEQNDPDEIEILSDKLKTPPCVSREAKPDNVKRDSVLKYLLLADWKGVNYGRTCV